MAVTGIVISPVLVLVVIRQPQGPTLFPYTTLFRSALYRARAFAALGQAERAEALLAAHRPTADAEIAPEQLALLMVREAEILRLLGRPQEAVAAATAATSRLGERGETLLLVDGLSERA